MKDEGGRMNDPKAEWGVGSGEGSDGAARGRQFAICNSSLEHGPQAAPLNVRFLTPDSCPLTPCPLTPDPCPLTPRSGISLLEVLVSLGVITIGLLGILSLFPVGAYKVGLATRHDRAAALGQSAFHDIITRGLLQPDRWVIPDINTNGNNVDWALRNSPPYNAILASEFAGLPPGGFAFDPLAYGGSVANDQRALLTFPTNTPSGIPYLMRVTQTQFDSAGIQILVGRALAEQVVRSRDDLIFDLPDDRDLPAGQLFKRDPSTSALIHRQYQGDYSWMFTAVPKSNSLNEDLYTVSVVVFHKRRLDIDPTKPPERMVQVDSVPGGAPNGQVVGGIGGVEANLYADPATLGVTSSIAKNYLEDIRAGEWVMLSANTTSGPIFKWYRVISVQDEIVGTGTGPFTRWVSLAGPDLDTDPAGPLDANNNGGIDSNEGVYISLFEGAIGVYEKTMRVEGSSMY